MGTEILHHNPNSKIEDYNSFYERMKNSGVKQYLVVCSWPVVAGVIAMIASNGYIFKQSKGKCLFLQVCLEHAFHFLVKGHFEEAKRQLSIAESWRYGRKSAGQSQRIKLIQAYKGFLDYLIWCNKKATLSIMGKEIQYVEKLSPKHLLYSERLCRFIFGATTSPIGQEA